MLNIRALTQRDLSPADRIIGVAFGTLLGAPEPENFWADLAYARTRWPANPAAAFGAKWDGEIVGSNFATGWGTVGFFGPLTGEAAVAAALVTPYLLEYGSDHSATYALLLLPLYVGVGRVRNHAHWQTDVVAGWAVGGLSGWYAHGRDLPIMIELLPHGFAVGYSRQF